MKLLGSQPRKLYLPVRFKFQARFTWLATAHNHQAILQITCSYLSLVFNKKLRGPSLLHEQSMLEPFAYNQNEITILKYDGLMPTIFGRNQIQN